MARHDFPPQDLKYAKAVRVVPRPGWAVAAALRVSVAAPVGSPSGLAQRPVGDGLAFDRPSQEGVEQQAAAA